MELCFMVLQNYRFDKLPDHRSTVLINFSTGNMRKNLEIESSFLVEKLFTNKII